MICTPFLHPAHDDTAKNTIKNDMQGSQHDHK